MSPIIDSAVKIQPQQARAKRTYEALLLSAQGILVEEGFEALTSNSIVERAGMTPPAFYRYFTDKDAVLYVLSQRLMNSQNDVLMRKLERPITDRQTLVDETRTTLSLTIDATQKFRGGAALLTLLRAKRALRPIRVQSHDDMADFLTRELCPSSSPAERRRFKARARLANEIGYALIEMLFEVGFRNRKDMLEGTACAIGAVYGDYFT